MTISNLQWDNITSFYHVWISLQTIILRPITFGWTYFIKEVILEDVFNLTLAIPNSAKAMYLL